MFRSIRGAGRRGRFGVVSAGTAPVITAPVITAPAITALVITALATTAIVGITASPAYAAATGGVGATLPYVEVQAENVGHQRHRHRPERRSTARFPPRPPTARP